jgi:hypothetical protein
MAPSEPCVLHRLLTYDVLPRAGVIGAGTGNIIYCAGAPAEAGNCAAEAHIGASVAHLFNAVNVLAEAAQKA